MKILNAIFFGSVVALALTSFSCSNAPINNDNDAIEPAQWAYPMKVGNRWNYQHTVSYTDSSDSILAADTHRVTTSIPRTDLLNGTMVFVVKDSSDTATESYVELRTDGLYIRGMIPGAFVSLCKISASHAIDPSASIYTHPRLLFPVQVTAGMSWILDSIIATFSDSVLNDTELITREYLGEETVSTGMGDLVCRKFKSAYLGTERIDYVSTQGLAKRLMVIDSFPLQTVTPWSYPNYTRVITAYREELVLTSAILQ